MVELYATTMSIQFQFYCATTIKNKIHTTLHVAVEVTIFSKLL